MDETHGILGALEPIIALLLLGVVAAGVTLTGTAAFVSDALLVALPPIVGGLATAALARRR